jgi:NADPH-dependent F420 reductase
VSTIAIIGSGNVGRALASAAVGAGHDVLITSADPAHAEAAALATGAHAMERNGDAAARADVVILAIPGSELDNVAAELRGHVDGTIVVDVTNKPTPNLEDLAADPRSAAEQLQALLPEAHVVKAFNTAFASRMAQPVVEGMAIDGFVAGDDIDAKAAVLGLVEELGFRPIDAGPLANARTLEALAWLNIYVNVTQGGSWQSGWKLVEPKAIAA